MRVQLFVTCLVDLLQPSVGERTVALLERLGCEVAFPRGQTCCGQPAANSGYPADARRVAERFLDAFGPTEGPIVAPFGSCPRLCASRSDSISACGPPAPRCQPRPMILPAFTRTAPTIGLGEVVP